MASFKPWLKMWVEWLHDPKMLKLTLAEAGAWWKLTTLARTCGDDGRLVNGQGMPHSLEDIMKTCHITSAADCKAFRSMLKKMEDEKSLRWDDKTLVVVNFQKRQEKPASQTEKSISDRVQRYREKWDTILDEINQRLEQIPPTIDRLAQHEAIKQKLADIGQENGYDVQSEFPIGEPGPYGPRRLDLCWLDKGKIRAAFEIDYITEKEGSLEKLEMAGTPNTFIILREPTVHIVRAKKREPEKKASTQPLKNREEEGEEEEEMKRKRSNASKLVTHKASGATNETRKVLQGPLGEVGEEVRKEGAEIFKNELMKVVEPLYEENIGKITGPVADELRDFVETYKGELDWVRVAFIEALTGNKRSWKYIRTTLENWVIEGGPSGRAAEKLRRIREAKSGERAGRTGGETGQQRSSPDRRDPLKADREAGWEVVRPDADGATTGGEKTS